MAVPAGHVVRLSLEFCSGVTFRAFERKTHEIVNSTRRSSLRNETRESDSRGFPRRGRPHITDTKDGSLLDGDAQNRSYLPVNCKSWFPLSYVFSETDRVWLELGVRGENAQTPDAFLLSFTAVGEKAAVHQPLRLVYTSSSTGRCRSPYCGKYIIKLW